MTGKLLIAIVGLLLIIPTNGSPMPGNDKSNENKTENEGSTKTGITSTEMPTDVLSKSNDTSQLNETKPKEMAATKTEPGAEKDEDLLYFSLRNNQKPNQMAYFNYQQPFYFVPSGYQPQVMQPQFMFNQPQMQMPFSYPMMFPPQPMNTNNYMRLHLPLGTFDDSNKFFAQQTHRQPFGMNIDQRNNKHSIWSLLQA